MARHTKSEKDKEKEVVEVKSRAPVEDIPEQAGQMTAAAANAVKEPELKGVAKGVGTEEDADQKAKAVLKWYRVLQTKRIMGMTGYRAVMPEGKEFSSQQYNVDNLKKQGVKLEEIEGPTF